MMSQHNYGIKYDGQLPSDTRLTESTSVRPNRQYSPPNSGKDTISLLRRASMSSGANLSETYITCLGETMSLLRGANMLSEANHERQIKKHVHTRILMHDFKIFLSLIAVVKPFAYICSTTNISAPYELQPP